MGGEPKALLRYGNETLIVRQVQLMRQVCDELIVVVNDPSPLLPYLSPGIRIVSDHEPDLGPLAGMLAALTAARHPLVWIVACDMPFISPHAARWMADRMITTESDAVVPFIGDRLHPLHGLYRQNLKRVVAALLTAGERRVTSLAEHTRCDRVPEEMFRQSGIAPSFVCNINTPEEYASIQ